MEEEASGAGFRLPNKQLTEEIVRMETVLKEIRACDPDDGLKGFRFSENPFFLKLCPRILFNPDDIGLVPGMYIPLDYWKLLANDADILGRGKDRESHTAT